MMGLIELFVRRRVLTTVLVLIAIILGILSYVGLGMRRFPEIDFPVVTVITRYPGGSPSEIETEITKRIEDSVSLLSNIDTIESFSQQGISQVVIQFDLEVNVDIKAVDVRNQVDKVVNELPEDAEEPIVEKFEFTQFPIVTLALSGPQDVNELYRIADENLETLLSQVPGVGDVRLTGGQAREVHVLLDARKLRKHRISIGQVVSALLSTNVDVPAGHITQPGREYIIRATGRFDGVSDVAKVGIPTVASGIVTVGDLGEVRDTYEERRTTGRFNGEQTVILAVQPRSDANEVEVADGVHAVLPKLRRDLPAGASLHLAEDTSLFIQGALANVETNMAIGIGLTAIVLFLFLKSWRTTFIAAIVMPTAVIVSFIGIRAAGFTLNIVSLLGLAIVIGVLVNNAILILENVSRHISDGLEPTEAAIAGSQGIALAIISSTATNLVVFLPIAFMGEMIGQIFRELGLTVVFATTVSLLVSFSLTPMMCGLLLQSRQHCEARGFWTWLSDHSVGYLADVWRTGFELVKGLYLRMAERCLEHRATTVLLTLLAVVVCLGLLALAGFEFMPPTDEGRFRVTVQTPVGTPLEITDEAVRRVEKALQGLPHLESYYSRVGIVSGQLGGTSEGVNIGEVSITVADRADRRMTIDQIANIARHRLVGIPSAQISVKVERGGPGEDPVAVEISGEDLDTLQSLADEVMRIVQGVRGTTGVSKSWRAGQPEMRVIPRQDGANRHGVDVVSLALELRGYIEGRKAGQFRDQDENYDLLVKLREEDREWADDLERMFVYAPRTGQMVRLDQVARLERAAGPTLITRQDRRRLVTVSGGLSGEVPLSTVLEKVKQAIDQQIDLPPDVEIEFGGEAETIRRNFPPLFRAMATAAVLTFLCVAGIIESFIFAIIIIMAIPVCLIGVSLAMLLGGVTINIFSLMGMIILVGMVVNNAIIVVDYATRQEAKGASPRDAVFEACRERFRMIIMANMTTIVALIPLSLGIGFAGEMFRPLAVVQMGGVGAAALLSLVVIPAVYVSIRRRGLAGGAVHE